MNSYTVNRYNVPTPGAVAQSISIPHTGSGSSLTYTFGDFKEDTKVIFITVSGAGVAFTVDGSAVNTAVSHRLLAGNQYYFNSNLVSVAKFAKLSGASATAVMYASELTN
jgi:hypothetical protein